MDSFNNPIVDFESKTNRKIISKFENEIVQEIIKIIESKIYLNSRLDSKITSDNQIEIRKIVAEFSNKYFYKEKTLKYKI